MAVSSSNAVGRETALAGQPPTGAAGRARAAAERAVSDNVLTLDVLGRRVELPPPDQLAFLAGLGLLAVFDVIDWPVAAALMVGHKLATSHHRRIVREFGEALEEA